MAQVVLILGIAFFITVYAIVRLIVKHNAKKEEVKK